LIRGVEKPLDEARHEIHEYFDMREFKQVDIAIMLNPSHPAGSMSIKANLSLVGCLIKEQMSEIAVSNSEFGPFIVL
jgi:hypothetical protein